MVYATNATRVLTCWDEFCVDENPHDFETVVAQIRQKQANYFHQMRLILVNVNQEEIERLLSDPEVTGLLTVPEETL